MNIHAQVRALISSVITLGLAISLMSLSMPVEQIHAAPAQNESVPTLVINEINWGGSPNNPNDQWVELYNPSEEAVMLASNPFELSSNGSTLAKIDSGMVMPGGYFVISRLASSASTLAKSSMVEPGLVLPLHHAHYSLNDESGTVVDQADNGGTQPLAGTDRNGGQGIASMARRSGAPDGTIDSSWFTSHSSGGSIDAASQQYGTPGMANTEVAAPTEVVITPLNPASDTPTVSGKAETYLVKVRFTKLSDGTFTERTVQVEDDKSFSVKSLPLNTGLYRISVRAQSSVAFPVYSAVVEPSIPGSPQNVYVVSPESAVLTPPTLKPYPTLVNVDKLSLPGTVASGASLVVSINGEQYGVDELEGRNTFSILVSLLPNIKNHIEVRAQDEHGNTSQPTIAEVTYDNSAPEPLLSDKVKLTSNPTGTADTINGMAGAAELGGDVELYADANLERKIASTPVRADGSFAELNIGDNKYPTVYVVVRDAAGNVSQPLGLSNGISFAGQAVAVPTSISAIQGTGATITWPTVPGAVNYKLRYKVAGGEFTAPMDVCTTTGCLSSTTLSNMQAGKHYIVEVAAVDQFGNITDYSERTFMTSSLGMGGTNGVLPLTSPQDDEDKLNEVASNTDTVVPTPVSGSVKVSPSPTPVPTSTPKAEEEKGSVKSAEDTATSRNWTPWIILAVLIGLALLATAGYFYWFGGEAGEAAVTASQANVKQKEEVTKKDESLPKDKKGGDREKRW